MNPRVQEIMSELRQALKDVYGGLLVRVVMFGSQARGDAAVGSAIDALVVLEGPVFPGLEIKRTGEVVSRISLKHDVIVSCTFVSAKRYESEKSPLLMNVRREGLAV